MKKLTYQTPEGYETIHEAVLLPRIELLQSRLTPLRDAYAAHEDMAKLLSRMRPSFMEVWRSADTRPIYLEITPTHLHGAGISISCTELDLISHPATFTERWAFLLAIADGLAAGLPSHAVEVFPLYLENGMNLAVGHDRAEIMLRPLRDREV